MTKIYVITTVLVILAAGALFFFGVGKKAEAPALDENSQESSVISEGMPAIEAPDTEEMLVIKEFVVTGKNFSFTPSLITVAKGDRVKIIFENTSGFHDFKIDEFGIAAKQAQSPNEEVLEFIADKIGSFEYYCSVGTHRATGMKGILKVE